MAPTKAIRICLAVGAAGVILGVAVTAMGGSVPAGLSSGSPVTAPSAPPPPPAAPSVAPQLSAPVVVVTPPPTPAPPPTDPATGNGQSQDDGG